MRPLLAQLTLLLLSAAASMAGTGDGRPLPPEPSHGFAVEALPPFWRAPGLAERAPAVANPGFEELSGNQPAQWPFQNAPAFRSEGSNHYVRVNGPSAYYQNLALPAPYQYIAFYAEARSELGAERGVALAIQADAQSDHYHSTRVTAPAGTFAPILNTFPILPGQTRLTIGAFGASSAEWLDMDNMGAFDEGLLNGAFEQELVTGVPGDWVFSGAAARIVDATLEGAGEFALLLPPGAFARQIVAAKSAGQEYFVTGLGRSTDGPGTLALGEDWLDAAASSLSSPTSATLALGEAGERFLWRSGNMDGCSASRVAFGNAGGPDIILDRISRGSTTVFPEVYYPAVGGGFDPELHLVAVWPGELASADVEIGGAGRDLPISIPMTVDRGVATASWIGGEAAPGTYAARFLLTDQQGRSIEITREFEIRAPFTPAVADAWTTDTFTRGAWIWLLREGNTDAELRPYFEAALGDGFNFGLVHARADQWDALVPICEELGLPFVAAASAPQAYILQSRRHFDFGIEEYADLVDSELADVLDSPQCLGFYIADEPWDRFTQQRAALATSLAAAKPEWKAGFTTLTTIASTAGTWDLLHPPIHWTDFYPFDLLSTDLTARLRAYSDYVAEQTTLAAARGRQHWPFVQAFSDPEFVRLGPPAATRAMIGVAVAHGCKGLMTFTYNAIGGLEGIRGLDLEEFPVTEVWREENARLAASGTALMELTGHAEPFAAEGPMLVTTAEDSAANTVVFTVSLDPYHETEAALEFTEPHVTLTELTTGESSNAQDGALTFTLEPGGWRAWRLSTGSIASATAEAAPDPGSRWNPPIVADVTLLGIAVASIEVSPSGEQYLVAGPNRVFVLTSTLNVSSVTDVTGVRRAEFADDSFAVLPGSDPGTYTLLPTFGSAQLKPGLLRAAGGGTDVAIDGNAVWLTASYLGVRLLERQPDASLLPVAHLFPDGITRDVFGSFAGGSALYLDTDDGIFRAAPSGNGGISSVKEWSGRRMIRGDVSPGRSRIAVARNRLGISLHRLHESGHVLDSRALEVSLDHVTDVAWIGNGLLAASDTDGDVAFYTVDEELQAQETARWLLEGRPASLNAVTANGARLALGYQDGRVVLLDVSGLLQNGWMLH